MTPRTAAGRRFVDRHGTGKQIEIEQIEDEAARDAARREAALREQLDELGKAYLECQRLLGVSR